MQIVSIGFMQIVSIGDGLYEMANPVFWEKLETLHEMSNPVFMEK